MSHYYKDIWDALDTKYGRKYDIALHFIDKFKNLEVTGQSNHHKFVKLYQIQSGGNLSAERATGVSLYATCQDENTRLDW